MSKVESTMCELEKKIIAHVSPLSHSGDTHDPDYKNRLKEELLRLWTEKTMKEHMHGEHHISTLYLLFYPPIPDMNHLLLQCKWLMKTYTNPL